VSELDTAALARLLESGIAHLGTFEVPSRPTGDPAAARFGGDRLAEALAQPIDDCVASTAVELFRRAADLGLHIPPADMRRALAAADAEGAWQVRGGVGRVRERAEGP